MSEETDVAFVITISANKIDGFGTKSDSCVLETKEGKTVARTQEIPVKDMMMLMRLKETESVK